MVAKEIPYLYFDVNFLVDLASNMEHPGSEVSMPDDVWPAQMSALLLIRRAINDPWQGGRHEILILYLLAISGYATQIPHRCC